MKLIRDVFAAFGVYYLFTTIRSVRRESRHKAEMKTLVESLPDSDLDNIEPLLHEIIQEAMEKFDSVDTETARQFVTDKLRQRVTSQN